MIRGYISPAGGRRRPFVDAMLHFPGIDRNLKVPFLLDTGAGRTILSTTDAERLRTEFGVVLASLPQGMPSMGVDGQMPTRTIETVLTLDAFSMPLVLPILEDSYARFRIPSLLGRDILSQFALYLEERSDLVLLLEPAEADTVRVHLPLQSSRYCSARGDHLSPRSYPPQTSRRKNPHKPSPLPRSHP